MQAAHDFFYLEWRDCVPKDMGHVGGVPVEAVEFIDHVLSIYSSSIYEEIGVAAWRSSQSGGSFVLALKGGTCPGRIEPRGKQVARGTAESQLIVDGEKKNARV